MGLIVIFILDGKEFDMFIGIVIDFGEIFVIEDILVGKRIWIWIEYDIDSFEIGVLIFCDGVCYIVMVKKNSVDGNWFEVELVVEMFVLISVV